jgi:hypothetical protein
MYQCSFNDVSYQHVFPRFVPSFLASCQRLLVVVGLNPDLLQVVLELQVLQTSNNLWKFAMAQLTQL